MAKAVKKKSGVKFQGRLVLNAYMLSLFGAADFETLAKWIKNAGKRQTDDGISQFCLALIGSLPKNALINEETLLRYDSNIIAHTLAIQGKRTEPIDWKYFQYLAMLFTEIYLDNFMNRRESFLRALNAFRVGFNAQLAKNENYSPKDEIDPITEADLRKLAFWSATGSGKTLIMQMNIQQYLHYYEKQGGAKEKLNRILLITPNEGLSRQHKDEFKKSGIKAHVFSKNSDDLLHGKAVEIIEITKLKEESSDKTVAIDAFEDNNLVLVDEGHRGSKGEVWGGARSRIAEHGFTFEYSATFGQAVAGNEKLAQKYAKSILFDYSYRYFYNDGYGKDYNIINLTEKNIEAYQQLYLTACLLSFYQQKILFKDPRAEAKKFNIENPLWVFVGGSVTATVNNKDISDIEDIIGFLANFTAPNNKNAVINDIRRAISGKTGLLDGAGHDVFAEAFPYIIGRPEHKAEDIYAGIMREIFNAESGGSLHIMDLKDADGEIALHLGADINKAFGVINVGDSAKLCKKLDGQANIHVSENKFHGSLFQNINEVGSKINILIGSKKFTEGWNSYRVSTMGLMNVGRSEGSQIIQLFGRGVRLHGYENSLKRHSARLPEIKYNEYLTELETLNIFGIRADYMDQFKKYLEEEGVSTEGWETITLPITQRDDIAAQKLKIISLKNGLDYKRDGEKPSLSAPGAKDAKRYNITLDWYPRLESQRSKGITALRGEAARHEAKLTAEHIAFLDMDALWFDLQQFKNQRGWFNLNIAKAAISAILTDNSWYNLLIPKEKMEFDDFKKVHIWQEIAAALLRKYCDRFYKLAKAKWEIPHREYQNLRADTDKGNFPPEYKVRVDKTQAQTLIALKNIAEQLNTRKTDFAAGKLVDEKFNFGEGGALLFEQHLYQPLLYADETAEVKISPVPLNEGEKNFVERLKEHYRENTAYFADKTLFLLRNRAKGGGMGFFEAGNFYPDFIMWLKQGNKQYISFIDPKGLRQVDPDSPKLEFYKTIKETQISLGDSNIILNSFIISGTAYAKLASHFEKNSKEYFIAQHILFAEDSEYIGKIFSILQTDTSNVTI